MWGFPDPAPDPKFLLDLLASKIQEGFGNSYRSQRPGVFRQPTKLGKFVLVQLLNPMFVLPHDISSRASPTFQIPLAATSHPQQVIGFSKDGDSSGCKLELNIGRDKANSEDRGIEVPQGCFTHFPFEGLKKKLEEPWADSASIPQRVFVREVLDYKLWMASGF